MSEQAQVGDTVRLTIIVEGQVVDNYGLQVKGYTLGLPNRTVEILSPPLPSEPGTFWLDVDGFMWTVDAHGSLFCRWQNVARSS